MKYVIYVSLIGCLFWTSCLKSSRRLPIIGIPTIENGDTLWPSIRDFAFINQDSQTVSQLTFSNKIYVADFFFTSCPTICPTVTKHMLKIYDKYKNDDRVLLLAHTIDPKRDDVTRLKQYADNLQISSDKWHFVTGEKSDLYSIAKDYMSVVMEDETAAGGFDHSGRIILVDKNRHVRSFANGTDPDDVERLLKDIDILLNEN